MERRHPAHRRACLRARAGKSPYDKTYVEECRIRAEAFFKEKEERKKAEELIKTQLAAEEAAASKACTDTNPNPNPDPNPNPNPNANPNQGVGRH